jgi:glycosyltransferase involved in cell wall biosynthesis
MLTTDAFGGRGGLAKYNRDFIKSLCLCDATREVVVIPRICTSEVEPLPAKVTFVLDGLGGKSRFLATALGRMMHRTSFDLVVCGHVNLLPIALLAAWRYRAPLVLCVYGIDVWRSPPSRAAARACAHIDGFVSISRLTADRFRSWAPLDGKREWILPNAIELDQFSPGPMDPGLVKRYGLEGRTVIATLARLDAAERMKGVDEVLEVLPRLLRRAPRLTYLVMGDGSDKSRLEEKARAIGVANSVVFTGAIDEREKVEHYRLVDAFVMPSRGEGFGFVFLEALACGIPVVASAVDGGREAVRDGELGVLVDPRSPDDIVRGIEEALAKPRGVVPPGLSYFAFENFTSRVQAFVDDVVPRSAES